ncbi:MAG: cell division protein ZapA [Paludibacteraceae bacterium]|nr:cell division protein ZapA [Paludibacteraceae bacterium]
MNSEKQHITLHLDAHVVGLDVKREDEPNYRQAAELLNKRYQHYLKIRPNASAEQLWMYTALEVAVSLVSDAREKSLIPVEQALESLNEEILRTLNSSMNQ